MPMKLNDIPKFERQHDISISVYSWEEVKKNNEGEDEIDFTYPLHVAIKVRSRHGHSHSGSYSRVRDLLAIFTLNCFSYYDEEVEKLRCKLSGYVYTWLIYFGHKPFYRR